MTKRDFGSFLAGFTVFPCMFGGVLLSTDLQSHGLHLIISSLLLFFAAFCFFYQEQHFVLKDLRDLQPGSYLVKAVSLDRKVALVWRDNLYPVSGIDLPPEGTWISVRQGQVTCHY